MTLPRKAARETYDALLRLLPTGGVPTETQALIKRTYLIRHGQCEVVAPDPLAGDFDSAADGLRLTPGSDFWPHKPATDFVIEGSAFAGGRAISMRVVSVRIAAVVKRVAVFGRRAIRRRPDGSVRIDEPDPFLEVPLTFTNAYGGLDGRIPFDVGHYGFVLEDSVLAGDHPGLYPRNPYGKAYFVGSIPDTTDLEMPSLEDPEDLLTEERLILNDPGRWYEQPLPWCLHWMSLRMFPRCAHFFGTDAWFPGPEDERMPEVRRGFLPSGFRTALQHEIGPAIAQEASCGLVLPALAGGEPVVLEGMHPEEPVIRFSLPPLPRVQFVLEGRRQFAIPRMHTILVKPAEHKLSITYAAEAELHRAFVPGIHARIPVSVSVDGDTAIAYPTPPTHRALAKRTS